MNIENVVSLVGGLGNMTAIKSPSHMYFCKIKNADNSICWGFLSPSDSRLEEVLVKVEVSIPQQQELISGGNIVYYNGEVFNADSNEYYLNENNDFVKRDSDEYNQIIADAKKVELVQTLYDMKSNKAYSGVIINNALVFETNQTSVTNTVATLALMQDNDTSSWKFYSITGEPCMQTVNKAQLFAIASFGRKMIDDSFKVEGEFLQILEKASVENLISTTWIESFLANAQESFDNVNNKLEVAFG